MNNLLKNLGYDQEEIEALLVNLKDYSFYKVETIINLLKKYNCHNDFIKEVINKRSDIFSFDLDRLEYIFDAIVSNNDIIEETLLEII